MDGRTYLDLAQELASGSTEVHWRGAAGRAYYALMLESREALFRWGFKLPPRQNVHSWVRLRLLYAKDADLKQIGYALDDLVALRNGAASDLSALLAFASDTAAKHAIQWARDALALLDAIEADPVRRAAAITAIQP